MAIDIEKVKTEVNELMDRAGLLDAQIDTASFESKKANAALNDFIVQRNNLRQKISDKLRNAKLLPED